MEPQFEWIGGKLRTTPLGAAWQSEPSGLIVRLVLESDYGYTFGSHSLGPLLRKYQDELLLVRAGDRWLVNTKAVLSALPPPRPSWVVEAVVPVAATLLEIPHYSTSEDWHFDIGVLLELSATDFPVDLEIYDAFIVHAHEDKEDFVRPLVYSLRVRGFKIWFDEINIRVGDSIRSTIDRGLSRSRFGIAVISPSFLQKKWPQYELDGLVTKEAVGRKVVLPIWYNIDVAKVREYSLSLADKAAAVAKTAGDAEVVANALSQVLRREA